jgi:arylsulfatase A-like enzyme/Tfp pilus assembly protein PilF
MMQRILDSRSLRLGHQGTLSLWGVALVALLASCGPNPNSELNTGPTSNLLLITLDTVRADHLGAYGYAAAQTPALDGLAARGALFENAYSPAPMTLPAHATLMTGLLPPEHGARVNGEHRLGADIPTLAERLAQRGYRTGAFVAAFVLDAKFGLDRGFDHYDDDRTHAHKQEVPDPLSVYRPANHVVDAALAWLDAAIEPPEGEPQDATPFFAWVHLYDAHYPWHGHSELEETPLEAERSYDAEIAFIDIQISRLLEFLESRGQLEHTWVVAVSDHGEGLGDHGEIEHGYLLSEEALRVAWIFAGPGVAAGARSSSLVALEDFFPTALELSGIEPAASRGRSLVPALHGQSIPSRASYAETDLPWTSFRWGPQRSITTKDWKYTRSPQPELYDRAVDRLEVVNLAGVRADQLANLDSQLTTLEAGFHLRESSAVQLNSEERAQLESLGYMTGGNSLEAPKGTLADIKTRLPAKDLATHLRRGLATHSLQPEEFLELALTLVAKSPETPLFHSHLGAARIKLGEVEAGISAYREALRLAPNSASFHYNLGDVLEQNDDRKQARIHFEAALAIDPEFAAAHVGMGNVLLAAGRLDLAAGSYSEAIRLHPGYAEAHYNLAQTFVQRDRMLLAREHLEAAIEYRPDWGLARYSLANLLRAQGENEAAVALYREALELDSNDADAHNNLGVALSALGDHADAKSHFERALKIRPNFFRPHLNLADAAIRNGDWENAIHHFEHAQRISPQRQETAQRLAHVLAVCPDERFRDAGRAIRLAKQAAHHDKNPSARLLDTLAAAFAAAGNFERAQSTAQEALERARLGGLVELAAAIEARKNQYAQRKPYMERPTRHEP